MEQLCFGERNTTFEKLQGCNVATVNALALGTTMIGIRVYDVMRAVDYLKSRKEVDGSRIGCMGISGGGTATLY
ncbi:MAG: prolyl oligopeptidase family serine peptidase [Candidatus Latescibacteria bacterium]|jgi:dipeptidyl aminopeptidase/acylaminoacyl peptidase|nr:prolyl oligopeptidase family serine peptidase [Candidatus Latescibacterota bacterium]